MSYDSERRSTTASHETRDEFGHFVPAAKTTVPSDSPAKEGNPITNLLRNEVQIDHHTTDDGLLDVHLGNPLRRITALLEEIKKQKALSVNMRMSIGVMGVAILIGSFGVFGSVHMSLCYHPAQSHVGVLRVLDYIDEPASPSLMERAAGVWDSVTGKRARTSIAARRVMLLDHSGTAYRIILDTASTMTLPTSRESIVTGDTDTCSNTITSKQPNAIQAY